jgi:hypothetical protein
MIFANTILLRFSAKYSSCFVARIASPASLAPSKASFAAVKFALAYLAVSAK